MAISPRQSSGRPRIVCVNVFFLVLAAFFSTFYLFNLRYTLSAMGVWRPIQPVGNSECEVLDELEACEKIVLHHSTGTLYLACSTIANRKLWTPSAHRFNVSGAGTDYLAMYNPERKKISRLELAGFSDPRGLSTHGFDVVPSSLNSKDLWFYIINHRPHSLDGQPSSSSDTVIEIFKGKVGKNKIKWVATVQSPLIHAANEVVGHADGKSFYWTNEQGTGSGLIKPVEFVLRWSRSSIGYCHTDNGCRIAASGLPTSNGLASAGNGTYYVGSLHGSIRVLERQDDESLVVKDHIQLDRCIDNLALDADGALYAAGFPKFLDVARNFVDEKHLAGSSALRIIKSPKNRESSQNRYDVQTIFEDDGSFMPPATSVVVDSRRRRLYLHGLLAPHLMICRLS